MDSNLGNITLSTAAKTTPLLIDNPTDSFCPLIRVVSLADDTKREG